MVFADNVAADQMWRAMARSSAALNTHMNCPAGMIGAMMPPSSVAPFSQWA